MELIRNKSNSIDVSTYSLHKGQPRRFAKGLDAERIRGVKNRDPDEIEMKCGTEMILPEYMDQWEFDDDHGHRVQLALKKIHRTEDGCVVRAKIIGGDIGEGHETAS